MTGLRLGRIAGIEVIMDWSLLIIVFLITFSLATALFPAWHPDWSTGLRWGISLLAALLFFGSVVVHELSHALVGRRHGIEVNRITLFIFGGMAQMESEPGTWRAELWMAIVGPVTSLVLGVACLLVASYGLDPAAIDAGSPGQFLAGLSPWRSLLMWLGNINVILAIFNLVPGFPLDGGRVLRAVLWGTTGDLVKATRWASAGGRGFAWLLIFAGLAMVLGIRVPVFGVGIGGLWLMLIGWFLHNAALMSYRQLLLREGLQDVPVSRLAVRQPVTVTGDMSVQALVDDYLISHDQRAYPVIGNGRLTGLVCLDDVRRLNRAQWRETRVDQLMTPSDKLITVAPADDAATALFKLSQHNVNQLPVVEDGQLRGLVRREDLMRWMTLRGAEDSSEFAGR